MTLWPPCPALSLPQGGLSFGGESGRLLGPMGGPSQAFLFLPMELVVSGIRLGVPAGYFLLTSHVRRTEARPRRCLDGWEGLGVG